MVKIGEELDDEKTTTTAQSHLVGQMGDIKV